MIRLKADNGQNAPDEFSRILTERAKKGPQWDDRRRWKALLKHYRGGSLLDIGTLDSELPAMALAEYPEADVWGLDQMGVPVAAGVKFKLGTAYATGFSPQQFDYIVLGEVLEHLEYPGQAVDEAYRILKPGGCLAVSVPLDEAKEPGACDPSHLWSISRNDMKGLLVKFDSMKLHVLGSRLFPYRYAWKTLVAFGFKK